MSLLAHFGRLFPRNLTPENVETSAHFDVCPEDVWQAMLFYEQVPRRPSPLLRMFLPAPVRTQGEKAKLGALVECVYDGGYLEKRITGVERARFIRFDVVLQQLGIEDSISMLGGSYEIGALHDGSEVVLMTRYCGHLRPRWLWRPLEHFLARGLHRHILDGMRRQCADAQLLRLAPADAPLRGVGAATP